jgi:hypothetical protein
VTEVLAAARRAVTRLAIWWIEREMTPDDMPHLDELPWLDASNHPAIVFGPGVIYPPGLLVDFEGRDDKNGPIQALGAYGSRDGADWLLGFDTVDTSEEQR